VVVPQFRLLAENDQRPVIIPGTVRFESLLHVPRQLPVSGGKQKVGSIRGYRNAAEGQYGSGEQNRLHNWRRNNTVRTSAFFQPFLRRHRKKCRQGLTIPPPAPDVATGPKFPPSEDLRSPFS